MTDQEKLKEFFKSCGIPIDAQKKSLTAAGRKYMFNDEGEIRKITDLMTLEEVFA